MACDARRRSRRRTIDRILRVAATLTIESRRDPGIVCMWFGVAICVGGGRLQIVANPIPKDVS